MVECTSELRGQIGFSLSIRDDASLIRGLKKSLSSCVPCANAAARIELLPACRPRSRQPTRGCDFERASSEHSQDARGRTRNTRAAQAARVTFARFAPYLSRVKKRTECASSRASLYPVKFCRG